MLKKYRGHASPKLDPILPFRNALIIHDIRCWKHVSESFTQKSNVFHSTFKVMQCITVIRGQELTQKSRPKQLKDSERTNLQWKWWKRQRVICWKKGEQMLDQAGLEN